uniref:Ubiquitin-conjugating enzyme family protein n=1 Tax=Tanacetum cinerariifolium TaxID=118510 RepID=A0A6L2KID6_TANCI|nr:ubiquitin-conjugating enzyme family protein [Tanacetum cinerariifolium]
MPDCWENSNIPLLDRGHEGSNESLTLKLKTDVVSFIKVLIDAFKSIGATEEAEEFLLLSEKKIPPPVNQTTTSARTRSATHSTVHTYYGHDFSPSYPYIPKQPPVIIKSKPPPAYNHNLLSTYYPKPPGTYSKPPGNYIPKPPPLMYKSQTLCQL